MWKMFITVLALNSNNVPSTAITVTDFPNGPSCFIAAGQIGAKAGEGLWILTVEKDGIKVTTKVNCLPVELGREVRNGQFPPPVAGMIQGFFGGLEEMNR